MKRRNRHERLIAAPPERVDALIADFDRIWPTQIAPAPRPLGHGLYGAGSMLWEEFDRPGAARAFRVLKPEEWRAEHWFELEPADGGTVLRHTVEGRAGGEYEAFWRDRVDPYHDVTMEALFDNVESLTTDPGAALASGRVEVGVPESARRNQRQADSKIHRQRA